MAVNLLYGQKKVAGCYRSNLNEAMFETRVCLNSDSGFYYRFAGDGVINDGKGRYRLVKDTVYLIFNKNIKLDSVESIVYRDIVKTNIKLFYRHNKLYKFDTEIGKAGTKVLDCRKRRGFLLFGSRSLYKPYYLKKFPCGDWKNLQSEIDKLHQ